MIVFPPCKINLGLYITGPRADGFHAISSVFYPIPLCDALEVVPMDGEDGTRIFSSSGLLIPGKESSNLVIRAYDLLHAIYGLPAVKIHLHKVIPMGAGLGGGSSDGAWMLRILNDLFQLHIPFEERIRLAAHLGSDCPFFMYDGPCDVSGRGEVLVPFELNLESYSIWIVNPGIHVSTAQAFQYVPVQPAPEKWKAQLLLSPENWSVENAFEIGVGAAHPEIQEVKNTLLQKGAVYVSMTGSGSSVYGIFKHKPAIDGIFPRYFSVLV